MPPPFPEAVDSTWINDFKNCAQKFEYSALEGLRLREESIHLIAGAAFAKGLEVTRKYYHIYCTKQPGHEGIALAYGLIALIRSYGDPTLPPQGTNKTVDRMCGALVYYFDTFPLATDHLQPYELSSGPAIEATFAFPTSITHPTTGNPILYAGRFDMIGVYKSVAFVVDEKTTEALGPSYPKQFDLRSQLTGYMYGAIGQGVNIKGSIVRAIAILKTEYKHLEIINYARKWELDRWKEHMESHLRWAVDMYRVNYWPLNLGDSCNLYGGCPYRPLCKKEHPSNEKSKYAIVRWDPLKREREVVRKRSPMEIS